MSKGATLGITAVNILAALGIVGFLGYQHYEVRKEDNKTIAEMQKQLSAKEKAKPKERLFSETLSLVISHEYPTPKMFCRISLVIEVHDAQMLNAIKHKGPQIQNTVTEYILGKPKEYLMNPENLSHIKEELWDKITDIEFPGDIEEIYITSLSMNR